jgi:hypothetical protein
MEAWARELLEVWGTRIPEIAEASMPAIERMWTGRYMAEDIGQMIRGAWVMVGEQLEGKDSFTRDDYLQTILPSLVAQGESVSRIAAIDMAVTSRIIATIVPELKPEHRAKAMDVFIEWQSRFLQDIVLTAIESGGKP